MKRLTPQVSARKEQVPQNLDTEAILDDKTNLKCNGLPPLPKTLNSYFFGENACFSTQPSQESSDVSSGISSSDRASQNLNGHTGKLLSSQASASNFNSTHGSHKGSSRLFKGASMCPPIANKGLYTPQMEH